MDGIYDRILLNVDMRSRGDVMLFLKWLAFSLRPMTLDEICETATVDFDANNGPAYNRDRRYTPWRVLEKCSSLVIESKGAVKTNLFHIVFINNRSGVVKLAHFSVKEYLISGIKNELILGFRITEMNSHLVISQTCLAYLLQFDTDSCLDSGTITGFALAPYAAKHWLSHAKSGGGVNLSEPTLGKLVQNLFRSHPCCVNWVRLWDIEYPWMGARLDTPSTAIAACLYYASFAGLYQEVRQLVEEGAQDVNAKGGRYGNALQATSLEGHEYIMRVQ